MHKTHVLPGGLTLVYQQMPSRSVSVGLWVRSGSIYETPSESGVSHYIEHMLFKGTEKRSALQISEEMDFVGGQLNAYTCRDYTCFHTKTLGENLELSLDILSDMYKSSVFDPKELEQERKVIIEEINMYEDSPEDVAHELLALNMWADSPYGWSISGTEASVNGITREMMLDYFRRRYTPENTVLSVAGCFSEAELISLAEKYFGSAAAENSSSELVPPTMHTGVFTRKKDIEQTHICMGWSGYPLGDERNVSLTLMNEILGGGMSSRLFQEVREKAGLCYSVYSFSSAYPKAGSFGIYTALSPENGKNALELINKVIEEFKLEGPTEYEINKTRSQLRCSCLLSSESTAAVMSRLGRGQLLRGKIKTDEEMIAEIEAVTRESVLEAARDLLTGPCATAIVSPIN